MTTTPPPAGPTPKAAATRAHILSTALRLFEERGYDNTSMREIAREAGLATGAAYYYFRSKPELVVEFYVTTSAELGAEVPRRLAQLRGLQARIQAVPELWLEKFGPHREFLLALFRTTVDPRNPLSPFSRETRDLRHTAISWFEQALEGAAGSVPKDLRPALPRLLWLYQMGIILFWLHDTSKDQARTRLLLAGTMELICGGLQLAGLPLLGSLRRKVVALANAVGLEEL